MPARQATLDPPSSRDPTPTSVLMGSRCAFIAIATPPMMSPTGCSDISAPYALPLPLPLPWRVC